jgi:hypothetical protein
VAFAAYECIIGPLLEKPPRVGKRLGPPLADLHSTRRGTYRITYGIDEPGHTVTVVAVVHRAGATAVMSTDSAPGMPSHSCRCGREPLGANSGDRRSLPDDVGARRVDRVQLRGVPWVLNVRIAKYANSAVRPGLRRRRGEGLEPRAGRRRAARLGWWRPVMKRRSRRTRRSFGRVTRQSAT